MKVRERVKTIGERENEETVRRKRERGSCIKKEQ